MREPKIINYPDMKVVMRKDFYDKFNDQLNTIIKSTDTTYFGHNIIKNYREKGQHVVSTFCNHEAWHDLYWDKYRNEDITEKIGHAATQKNNFAVISWGIDSTLNPCGQERMKRNKVKEGIIFSFRRPENYIETFLVGWGTLNTDRLNIDYIAHLTSLFQPIRDYHWEVHDKV